MKKLLLIIPLVAALLIGLAAADMDDWHVFQIFNISDNVSSPQSLAYDGALTVLDWNGSAVALIIDSSGNTKRLTSISSYLGLPGGVSYYNRTHAIFANYTGYVLANSSDYTSYTLDFQLTPGTDNANISGASVRGICANETFAWFADNFRNAIHKVILNTTGLYNTSSIDISATATNISGMDCTRGADQFYVLDTERVFILDSSGSNLVTLNLSGITGISSGFQGVAVDASGTDIYVLNNVTDVVYHLRQFYRRVFFRPDVTMHSPTASLTEVYINTDEYDFQINYSYSFQPINGSSQDNVRNCSTYLDGTINSTQTVLNSSNTSNWYLFNFSLQPKDYTYNLECCVNVTFGGCKKTGRQNLRVRTLPYIFWLAPEFGMYYDNASNQLIWNASNSSIAADIDLTEGKPVHLTLLWDDATNNRTILIDGAHAISDSEYHSWLIGKADKFYLGSRNHSGAAYKGQFEGIIDYFRISNHFSTDFFTVGDYSPTWTTKVKEFFSKDWASYFYQFRVILTRAIDSEKPVELKVNISYNTDLFNQSLAASFLDFGFDASSGTAAPAGQTPAKSFYTLSNYGDTTINVTVHASSSVASCLLVSFFNTSTIGVGANMTVNLSNTPQTIKHRFLPNTTESVWINATATNCGPGTEAFDIIFDYVR